MDPQRDFERVNNHTENPDELRRKKLLELFPEVAGDIDSETGQPRINSKRLLEILAEDIEDGNEHYELGWAGKSAARRSLQLPTAATLKPAPEESIDWETTRNVFIEGENYEALKLMLRPYYGRVKMIYIDPPYNTGNDFVYPDNFAEPLDAYLRMTGQKDGNGDRTSTNGEKNGRFHSNWLNMMYPRLFLARQLLREDGVIFISIDDNEVHNLRMLMNEVFGEENFVAAFIWKRRQNVDSRAKTGVSTDHEYCIVYRRSCEGRVRGQEKDLSKYSNPDNDPRGPWSSDNLVGLATREQRPNLHYDLINPNTGITYACPPTGWRYHPPTMNKLIGDGRILWPALPSGRARLKRFQHELVDDFTGITTVVDTVYNTQGTRELGGFFDGHAVLDFPKPSQYIKLLVQQGSSRKQEDIVIDFFSGSGTTAQAVLELNREDGGNRHFVMVQLPEQTDEKSAAREAGFSSIAEIGKERIRRVIAKMNEEGEAGENEDRGFRVYKLAESTMEQWTGLPPSGEDRPDAGEYGDQMELFNDPLKDGWKPEDVIAELVLKNAHMALDYRVDVAEEVAGQTVYRITEPDTERVFYVCLDDDVNVDAFRALNMTTETLCICRAIAFDDEKIANMAMQCKLRVI